MKIFPMLLILFIVSLSMVSKSQTIFKLNQYNIVDDGRFIPVFTLYSGQSFNEKWGVSTYFYINGAKESSWGQGLAGATFTPVKGLSLSFLAGFQTNEDQLWRISPLINYAGKRISGFAAFEYGGKRHRWDIMAFYNVKKFKFGAEMIRFYQMYAFGPRIEFSVFNKQPITFFYTGLWDITHRRPSSMFGVFSTFGTKR